MAPLLDLLLAAHRLDPGRVPAERAASAPPLAHRLRRRPARSPAAAHADPSLGRLLVRPAAAVGRRLPALLVDPQRRRLPPWPDGLLPSDETARLRAEAHAILRGNLVVVHRRRRRPPAPSSTRAVSTASPPTSPIRWPTIRTGHSSTLFGIAIRTCPESRHRAGGAGDRLLLATPFQHHGPCQAPCTCNDLGQRRPPLLVRGGHRRRG